MTDTDATAAPAATGIPLRKRAGCMCGDLGPEPARSAGPAGERGHHRHTFDDATLERVVAFHGHLCPGLAMGMQAAAIALREVGANAAGNEVTAVVETDMCGVDGIQFLTGCTFGEGQPRPPRLGQERLHLPPPPRRPGRPPARPAGRLAARSGAPGAGRQGPRR